MKQIKGINHIGIRISNLDNSKKFYQKFGFEFIGGPLGPEPIAIMRHPCGLTLNFIINADSITGSNVLMDFPDRLAGYTHMALDIIDFDNVPKQIQQHNINITEGPITLPDGGKMFFIRDPDQNVIEFHQSPTK